MRITVYRIEESRPPSRHGRGRRQSVVFTDSAECDAAPGAAAAYPGFAAQHRTGPALCRATRTERRAPRRPGRPASLRPPLAAFLESVIRQHP